MEANVSDDLAARTRLLPTAGEKRKKGHTFEVPYDKLVIACGSYSQTFGIEGVMEHAFFLRDVALLRRYASDDAGID